MGKGEVKPSALAKLKAQQKQSILQKTKKASNEFYSCSKKQWQHQQQAARHQQQVVQWVLWRDN
jgi:hypothetical protein